MLEKILDKKVSCIYCGSERVTLVSKGSGRVYVCNECGEPFTVE